MRKIKDRLREANKKRTLIHKKLASKHPEAVKKAKRIFKFKYPKLLTLIIISLLTYFIFSNPETISFINKFQSSSYIGIFIAGILFSFGFSAPLAIGFFVVINPSNIFLASLIGGIGSVVGDLLIFKLIRYSFMNEFEELQKTRTLQYIKEIVKEHTSIKIRHYIIYGIAGIFLSSPLPDEVGVSLLAGLSTINQKALGVISFVLHAIPIYLLFLI